MLNDKKSLHCSYLIVNLKSYQILDKKKVDYVAPVAVINRYS
jgi:hypothetical protein